MFRSTDVGVKDLQTPSATKASGSKQRLFDQSAFINISQHTSFVFLTSSFLSSTRPFLSEARCMNFICDSLLEKLFLPATSFPDMVAKVYTGIQRNSKACDAIHRVPPAGAVATEALVVAQHSASWRPACRQFSGVKFYSTSNQILRIVVFKLCNVAIIVCLHLGTQQLRWALTGAY